MRIFNKFIESKKEPSNKNDIWFDGSVFRIYKEEAWKAFTVNLNDANEIAKLKDELYEFLYDEAKPTVEEAKQAAATIQEYVDKAIDALVLAQQSLANSESAITEATALKSQTEQLIEQGNIVVENANKATDNANETSSNIKAIWDDLFVEINNSIASANEAADRANNSIVFYPISDEDVSIIMGNLPRTDSFVEEYTGHTYVYNNKYGLWYLTSDLSICIAVPSIQSYNIEDEGRVFIQNINYIYNSETNRYERQGLYGKLPIRLLWDGLEEFGGQKEALFTNDGGHNILLKTKQQLDDSEKNQVKENLGITDYDDAEIKQELTELSEEIEHQDIFIEDLQNTKIDKEADDYYPKMAVGLADNLSGVDVVDSEINFRRSGGGAISDGVARIEAIKGNSVVWNQLYGRGSYSAGTWDGNILTINRAYDSEWKSYDTTSSNSIFIAPILNHKYFVSIEILSGTLIGDLTYVVYPAIPYTRVVLNESNKNFSAIITEINESNTYWFLRTYREGNEFTNVKVRHRIYDLTQMFGTGNEPTTIEEFYARIPMGVDLNAYNEGEVIHMDVQSIESQGVNAWDEEWELGNINVNDGNNSNSTTIFRSKNYNKVLPSTEYYVKTSNSAWIAFLEYDAEKNFLRNRGGLYGKITTSSDCHYVRFWTDGTTYNHDICINISDASINGKYFPYIKRVEDLSIIRKYFPQGMKSAGSAHDDIRYNKATQKWEHSKGRIKEVDMGNLNWKNLDASNGMFYLNAQEIAALNMATHDNENIPTNLISSLYASAPTYDIVNIDKVFRGPFTTKFSGYLTVKDTAYNDAAAFKAMLQEKQVKLYYESNDWEWVELDAEDQFKDLDYQVWNCGTEKAIAEGKSAPLAADITYGFNAIGKIKELEEAIKALQTKVASL